MIPKELAVLLNNCEWERALAFIDSIPDQLSEELREKKAWCYSRTEKYVNAIEIYSELIKIKPQNAKYLYSLGYQYYAQKDYNEAVKYFELALKERPNYFIVKYRLAYSYIQLAGIDRPWTKDIFWKAIQQLKDAHLIYQEYSSDEKEKNKSNYADICALHGKAIVNSQRYVDKAIEYFTLSLSLKHDEDVVYQLAKAYYQKTDYSKALETIETILNCKRPKYYAQELKSQILSDCGRIEESTRILQTILKYRKKDYLYQRLVSNCLALGDANSALQYAQNAIDLGRENYRNYLVCGQVYKEMAKYKTAIKFLEQARAIKQKRYNSDVPEALQLIDEIMEITQNKPIDGDEEVVDSKINIGRILRYNSQKGFGFIQPEIGDSIFFHISNFIGQEQPRVGLIVCYELAENSKGIMAVNVKKK